MTRYLLDANVFIQAKNLHYGFDFCPAFWEWMSVQNGAGNVASVEKVADELASGQDNLTLWAKERGNTFFLPPDDTVLPALGTVSVWANGHGYAQGAVATFLQVADCWLVAHALAHEYTVVTHEVPKNSTKKIKIPNACKDLGLHYVGPFEMLRRERAEFVLGR